MTAADLDRAAEDEYPRNQGAGLQKAIYLLDPDEPFSEDGRSCRTTEDLAEALNDGFSFYVDSLADANHRFYLYLEAHQAKKEADTFRAYFKTFSPKRALNTIILELAGTESITIGGLVHRSRGST